MNRVIYFDLLKILAIVLVIINHSYWYVYNVGTVGDYFVTLLLMISKIAVPLFFMVSGALILKKETSYKEIFTKRILRVLIPLIIISALWTIYNKESIFALIPYLLNGNSEKFIPYWIWYLYAMIALYLMTPFLQKMLKNFQEKDYIFFIILFLILPSTLKFISAIFPVIINKNIIFNPDFLDILFPEQIGYFVIGYYLANKNITKKIKNVSIILFIISTLFATLFTIIAKNNYLDTYNSFDSYLILTTTISSISIFTLFKYYFARSRGDKHKLISTVSNTTFGIYLFHVFVIIFLSKLSFIKQAFALNGFLGLFIMDLITVLSLIIIIYFLRKIPIVKKFL